MLRVIIAILLGMVLFALQVLAMHRSQEINNEIQVEMGNRGQTTFPLED